MRERTDLGFADALDDFDPAEWAAKPAASPAPRPEKAQTRKAAAAAGFRSREPRPEPDRAGGAVADAPATGTPVSGTPVSETPVAGAPVAGTPVRRRRTGRNAQFNLKARPETIAAFCAVADQQGWGLGETLEYAVTLLEREYRRP